MMTRRTLVALSTLAVLAISPVLAAKGRPAGKPGEAGGDFLRYQEAMGWKRDYSVTMETVNGDMTVSMHMAHLAGKARMGMAMPGTGIRKLFGN